MLSNAIKTQTQQHLQTGDRLQWCSSDSPFAALSSAHDRAPYLLHRTVLPVKAVQPASGPLWVHEIKHDGYALMVRRDRLARRGLHPQRP